MFRKLTTTRCVLNLSSGLTIKREPLQAKVADLQAPGDPGYPVDYFVPNLGADREIADTQKHLS